jgi:hypothetical protein
MIICRYKSTIRLNTRPPKSTSPQIDCRRQHTTTAFSNIHRVDATQADVYEGTVHWSPKKSLFITSMWTSGIIGGYYSASWETLTVFLTTSAVTLCGGHSLGMHRKLIHNSFQCPKWLEYTMVYLGTLIGMAGPLGMIYTHDIRDWAQRQTRCHDYFCHRQPIWIDAFWQLHCDIKLKNPPLIVPEERVRESIFYKYLATTSNCYNIGLFWGITLGDLGCLFKGCY